MLTCILKIKSRDDGYLAKRQALDVTSGDETKLRDCTLKLAKATSSIAPRLSSEPDTGTSLKAEGNIEQQKLGVVSQTISLGYLSKDGGAATRAQ